MKKKKRAKKQKMVAYLRRTTKKRPRKKTIVKKKVRKIKIKKIKRKKKAKKGINRKTKRKKEKVIHILAKSVFTPEKITELIKKGRERGFVTFSEILYFFPNLEKNINGLEKLFEDLENQGIEIKETREFLEEPSEEKKRRVASLEKIDSIQIYLKEIGKISPIDARTEKEFTKSGLGSTIILF